VKGVGRVIRGEGRFSEIGAHLKNLGANKVFVVCGKTSFSASGAAKAVAPFRRQYSVTEWHNFSENPSFEELTEGLVALAESDADTVLGVGGGTALDLAKMMCAFAESEINEVRSTIERQTEIKARRMKLILAPTTSGSGSEATHFSVVYLDGQKFSVRGPALRADLIFVDPNLTASTTPRQRAISGLDALSQAIESLWSVRSTVKSRRIAKRSLRLIWPALKGFAGSSGREFARDLSWGSHLAGRAIDITQTTAPHALSYHLTSFYGVPHGNAVALLLGAFIDFHQEASHAPSSNLSPRESRQLARVTQLVRSRLGIPNSETAADFFKALLSSLGLASSLHEVGAGNKDQLIAMVKSVNSERMANNPVPASEEELLRILQKLAN
jgi:alcohol dehydrogenase